MNDHQPSRAPAIIAICFLLFAVSGRWPYSFYTVLRFVACGSAIYLAVQAHNLGKRAWVWIMGATAVLLNPLIPMRLHRSDWKALDFIAAALFAVSLVTIRCKRQRTASPGW
jgi:hypothetical protein